MIIEAREVWLKDGEKLILRSPMPADAENLLNHLRASFRKGYRNMNQPSDYFEGFSLEKEAEILNVFAESDSRFMISAFEAGGSIFGNLGCFGNDKSPFLKHSAAIGMDCHESYQGRGLGTQLLRTAMFEAKAKGFRRLDLSVRTFNKAGIALYEKVGFKRIGHATEIAFIDGEYFDEYLYELKL